MNTIIKSFWMMIFFAIKVHSQTTLSIKLTDSEYQTKNIEIEIMNNTNKTCKIPIDTSDFQPYLKKTSTSLRPFIEIKYKGKQINLINRFAELNKNEIEILNEGGKISSHKEKYDIFEIKPMATLKIVIPFNPFEFNLKKDIYNSYQILFNEDYELRVYLKSKKTVCLKNMIESNTVIAHWN